MNAIALQERVSKLKGADTDCTLPGKTFIWLPFVGGISAFAVILPEHMGIGHGVGGGYPDAPHRNFHVVRWLGRRVAVPLAPEAGATPADRLRCAHCRRA
jgi:hypothetical protein